MGFVFLLLGLVVAGVVAALRGSARARRQRELMLLCREAGLDFTPVDTVAATLLPFRLFAQGEDARSENVVEDRRDDGRVRVFDYSWCPKTDEDASWTRTLPGRSRPWGTRHVVTCCAVTLPFAVSPLEVVPREAWDGVAETITGDAIALDLAAFNRRFRVACEDRRFAVAFLDQRMMETMLSLPDGARMSVDLDTLLVTAPLQPAPAVLRVLEVGRRLRERVPSVVASLYPPRPMESPHEARWLQGHWSADPVGGSSELGGVGDPVPGGADRDRP